MIRCLLLAALMAIPVHAADPFVTILDRLREDAQARLAAADVAQARAWLVALPADGWWKDVPRQQAGRAAWQPLQHLARAAVIATAGAPGGPLADSDGLDAALVRAIDAWAHAKPRSDNWWNNEIGAPLHAATILACRRELPSATFAHLEAIIGAPLDRGLKNTFTGQNLAWRAGAALPLACHRRDAALAARAAGAIAGTARIGLGEGPQPDGSFHQHGPQLYSGGYGRAWIGDMARWGAILAGTPWAFDAQAEATIDTVLVDGLCWMARGAWLCPAVTGREVSRERGNRLGAVAGAARTWARLRPALAPRLERLAALPDAGGSAVHGARHFWRSGYSAIHRPGFAVGILAATTRTARTESGNGENLLGALLADGATWVRRRGDEAAVLLPVLDWLSVPGTCAAAGTPLEPGIWKSPAESAFGGGVASGERLVHGWDLQRGAVRGAQAWFAVRDGLVVLLAGIGGGETEVHATACQLPVRGAVETGGTALAAESGRALPAGSAVVHDGLAWLALDDGWSAERRTQRGAWRRININGDESEVAIDTLTIRRRFGSAADSASATWAVVEAGAPAATTPTWRILANTRRVQAVADADGEVLAVFREAGSIGDLAVDRPAIVLVEPHGDGWRLTAADPLWTVADYAGGTVRATWRGRAFDLALPIGPLAGAPVATP